ncbi:MAG TPA: radical SAM protein [Candidatus Ozemobacteraceae bacterium]
MRQPTIEWQVIGSCNYSCSYCIQSPAHRKGAPDAAAIDAFLSFFSRLPGGFEIKMSGGEPFTHPTFLEGIVGRLMSETPHRVSVLTNLSASRERLARFARLTRGRLGVVSASLHLESVTPDEFINHALYFKGLLSSDVRLVINTVLVPGRLDRIARAAEQVRAAGLQLFPQLMKTKTGVAIYPEAERPLLALLLGDNPGPRQANLAPSYRGRRCHAGVEYFVVSQNGDVWSCRTAKRHGEGRLGNVLAGDVRPADGPRPCPWDICPCTVPANRGMIEGIGEEHRA